MDHYIEFDRKDSSDSDHIGIGGVSANSFPPGSPWFHLVASSDVKGGWRRTNSLLLPRRRTDDRDLCCEVLQVDRGYRILSCPGNERTT